LGALLAHPVVFAEFGALKAQVSSGARAVSVGIAGGAGRPQGWIGLTIDLRETWRTGAPGGASVMVITDVYPGSPAASAGLQIGDTIVRINSEVAGSESLARALAELQPGRNLSVAVRRKGQIQTVNIRSATRPAEEIILTLSKPMQASEASPPSTLRQEFSVRLLDPTAPGPGENRVLPVRGPSSGADTLRLFGVFNWEDQGPRSATFFEALPNWPSGLPVPSPLEVVLERQSIQLAGSGMEAARRAVAEDAARSAVRTSRPQAAAQVETVRPLSPYILGQDWIAGARLTPVNPGLAEYFGVRQGLRVVDVAERTPAADAGITAGDVIVLAEGREISTVDGLRSLLAAPRSPATLGLTLVRKGKRIQVALPR
jgi:membrane-associated protease RseP (regulator of RpoE activity)